MRLAIILPLAMFSATAQAVAQCNSLPQLAATSRVRPVEVFVTSEILAVSLDEVIAAAEIAVEGTVHPIRTYLSDDECSIYTDYSVTVLDVLFGKLPKSTSGASQLVVTTRGGDLTIDGVQVRYRDQQLPPLAVGQHVILVLSRTTRNSRLVYEPAHGVFGAFGVNGDRATHLLRFAGSAAFEEMEKATLVGRIRR